MHLLIIGAGPAGEAAARTARRLSTERASSLDITIVERAHAGGLCLNRGCVPSKALLEQVHKHMDRDQAVDWAKLHSFKDSIVQTLRGHVESAFKSARINTIKGVARFKDSRHVEVSNEALTTSLEFDKAIIATGTEIYLPPPLDQFRDQFLNSDRVLNITKTPRTVIVVGGGAVGCEFACLLHAAGAQVTIVELKDTLLPGEDAAVAAALQRSYEQRGIQVRTNNRIVAAERSNSTWKLALSQGDVLESEEVLVCVGRVAQHVELNVAAADIQLEKNSLILNSALQTTNPNVFAAGDAASTRLAHAASAQGEVAAINALGGSALYDDSAVPRCLYSWPEVASVGAWKYQWEEANRPVKTSRAFFKGAAKALAADATEGFVQIVSEPSEGRIIGAQIIGPHATELIHIFSVALKAKMTTRELSDVMFAHPTLGEVIRDAARR
jgi:dihydrolipoamide dehydrogenase